MKISLPSSKRKSSISPVAVDKSKLKSLRGKSKQLEVCSILVFNVLKAIYTIKQQKIYSKFSKLRLSPLQLHVHLHLPC